MDTEELGYTGGQNRQWGFSFFYGAKDPSRLPCQDDILHTTNLPRIPECAHCPHTPLQSIEDGGLHDVVAGGKLMQTLLLHLSIVLSFSGIIFLMLGKARVQRGSRNVEMPCNLTLGISKTIFKVSPIWFHLTL